MGTLIQNVWIEKRGGGAGRQRHATPRSRDSSRRRRDSPSRRTRPTRDSSEQSGMTEDDVLERVRIQALAAKLTRKIQDSAAPVTDAQIQSYYDRNRAQFALPERRDVRDHPHENRGAGERRQERRPRRHELGRGRETVLDRRRLEGDRRRAARRQPGPAGQSARRGRVQRAERASSSGRSEGQFGWYLLRVPSITPARQTPLADVESADQSTARRSRASRQKMNDVHQRLPGALERRRRTAARATSSELCKNAPKPRTRRRPPAAPSPPAAAGRQHHRQSSLPRVSASRPEIQEALLRLDDAHAAAAARVSVGSRAGRAHDRPAHARGGLRAGRRRAPARRRASCSTSSATCCSRSTSSRCCWRSAAPATSPRSPSTAARS